MAEAPFPPAASPSFIALAARALRERGARALSQVLDRSGPLVSVGVALGVAGGLAVVLALGMWRRPPAFDVDAALPKAVPVTVVSSGTAPFAGPGVVRGTDRLVVHVAGAVAVPGLVEVPAGARVADVVDAAGGFTADADRSALNLAEPVADGVRVLVPRLGEVAVVPGISGGGASGSGASADHPVDLNRAGVDQLEELPGVGPATAAAIVEYRERNGPFATVDDLESVPGIGPAKLERIRDHVVV